jgi:dTDP-4-dehydrorhamnose reductase
MKKKKVWVLGCQGMLGHIVEKWFNVMDDEYDIFGFYRKHFNAINYGADLIKRIDEGLEENKPDIIINCVGILNTHMRGENDDLYADVNIIFPRVIASYCKRNKIKFIHVSTNCVYKDLGPHYPDSKPNATDIYGFSKALGEIDDGHALTIRCSIIGTENKGFGTGMINQFLMNPAFSTGYANAYYNGVTTLELAKFIERSIHRKGIVNYYTRDAESKYEILKIVKDLWNVSKDLKKGCGNIHTALLAGDDFTTKTFYEQLKELKDFNDQT